MEESAPEGKLKQLLQQIQQDASKQGSAIPKGGQEVTPQAGFVVKTTDQDNRKVFINVCGSDKVPMAGGWTDGKIPDEAKRFLETAEPGPDGSNAEVECCRFPLSLGEAKLETDKQGELCTVYDVVYNDQALTQAKAFRHLKVFLITFAINWIQQQKTITLNAKYKLPKMHYKGERITPQIMRMDKQMVKEVGDVVDDPDFPLMTKRRPITVPGPPKSSNKARQEPIQAATSSSQAQAQQQGADTSRRLSSKASNAGSAQSIQPASPQGQAELTSAVEYIGRPVEHVLVTIDGPKTFASASITAQVAGDHLYFSVPGYKQLDVQLHFAVSTEGASSELSQNSKQLCLKLPYMPCRAYLEQLHSAKQQQEQLTDLSFDSYLELEP